jgi:VanZ family protein
MNARSKSAMTLIRCAFFAALALTAVIALYPNLTLPEPALTRGFTDKIYHVIGFVALIFLAGNAWQSSIRLMISMVCLALMMELLQFLAEGRGVFITDLVANFVGVAVGLLLLHMTRAWRRCSEPR